VVILPHHNLTGILLVHLRTIFSCAPVDFQISPRVGILDKASFSLDKNQHGTLSSHVQRYIRIHHVGIALALSGKIGNAMPHCRTCQTSHNPNSGNGPAVHLLT